MSSYFRIGNKWLGDGKKAVIIAEIGSNFDGKLEQAKNLINIASNCGVDFVKFQLFNADEMYSHNDREYEVFKANELPLKWVPELVQFSRNKGIDFIASPFSYKTINFLDKIGVIAFKWASSETTNLKLLRTAALKNKPMIISTGMCDIADVYEAVDVVKSSGNDKIALLQCTSLYPTKPINVNLQIIEVYKKVFNCPVGFSDHTLGIVAAIASIAKGANIIEKHITLSRKLKGPDHKYAIEPHELKMMVKAIRDTEKMLGSSNKIMIKEESLLSRRESIIAKKNIKKGSLILKDKIILSRPGIGLRPRYLDLVINSKAKRNIKKGEYINWDHIE